MATERIHLITKLPMKRCPSCGRPSGLTGIDGKPCMECSAGWSPEDEDEWLEAILTPPGSQASEPTE